MQKLQLSIPEPCHENWQQMTPTDQGRFCNACAKEVIDFSTMTDIQVLNYFTNMANEKVCGRALPEQLDRTLSRPEHPKKKIFWYWNYLVMFLMFFTKGNSAKAQLFTKPATELSPVKNMDVRGDVVVGGEIKRNARQRVVTGKVTDKDGNPVSFASIRIKGINSGVVADANGVFKINTESNSVLVVSAVGFKEKDLPVANQTEMKIILSNSEVVFLGGAVVVAYQVGDGVYSIPENQKLVSILSVKDSENSSSVNHATIILTKKGADKSDIVFTDTKGCYKLKGIKNDESFDVKVQADGYEPNEFTIDGSDFNDRKKEWVVLLKKQILTGKELRQSNINNALAGNVAGIQVRSQSAASLGKETHIRVGGVVAIDTVRNPIYVVDGIALLNENLVKTYNVEDISFTDNIEGISFLNAAQATTSYGIKGANGAILITTKKLPVKNLDTVTVTAFSSRLLGQLTTTTCTTTTVMGGMMKGITVKSTVTDSLKMLANKITGAIKVYPNPVEEGVPFNVALKLKQAGLYLMQVTDAAGRIVLQKQINANSKEVIEKIMADSRWSAGIYYVSIINSKNQLTGKTSFIFE